MCDGERSYWNSPAAAFPVHGYSNLSPGLPGGEQTGLHKGDTWSGVDPCEGRSAMHLEALKGQGLTAASLCASSFHF